MLKINSFDLLDVSTYCFLWTTLYFVSCLFNSARSYEWHCRVVTTAHAIIISSLAIYCTFRISPWPFTDAGGPNSPMQIKVVSICLGYFIFDMIWCLYFRTEGPAMMAHHSLSIVGLTWCLLTGYYGTELVTTIAGAEITNPLLQLRWFLRETGNYSTLVGDVVDWAFMLSFGFFRLGIGSVLLYSYYQQDTSFWGRVGGTCIYLIGWVFFINIISYAIRKYKRRYGTASNRLPVPSAENSSESEELEDRVRVREVKDRVNIITEDDIPSQSEIKYGDRELTLRKNCIVQESIETYT